MKFFSTQSYAFTNGEKDKTGREVEVKAPVGFNEVPDWVAQTDLYKLAVTDGSIKPYKAEADSEAVLKQAEELAAAKDRIKQLEEQLELKGKSEAPKKLTKKELAELTKSFEDKLAAAKDPDEANAIVAEAAEAGITINPKQ